jgi:hypothetical protein
MLSVFSYQACEHRPAPWLILLRGGPICNFISFPTHRPWGLPSVSWLALAAGRQCGSALLLGYLDRGHYNFSDLKKHHYNSPILKFAITILILPDPYHFLHLPTAWTHTSDHICVRMTVSGQKTCTDSLSTR